MAEFLAVTASNSPKLKDYLAVTEILSRYFVDPDLILTTWFDAETGEASLLLSGYTWPEAWRIPEGVEAAKFDPYRDEHGDGADGFRSLLEELSPFLAESLTVQAVGSTKCSFPLSACEWHIGPGCSQVAINEFRHGHAEAVLLG